MNCINFDSILSEHCGLKKADSIVIGFSGGPDSTALLHLFCKSTLCLKLYWVYVDHGLRPDEVIVEKAWVNELCRTLGMPGEIKSVDVIGHKNRNGLSTEESCRILRYEALEDARNRLSADYIAVGHTMDDQAEEILLRLIRGTGLQGLSGMKFSNGYLIRPLLGNTKNEIIQYLHSKNISFCIDSSNNDRSFLRNRIRMDLLPELVKNFNPSIRRSLIQTADILQSDNLFIDKYAVEALHSCTVTDTLSHSSILKFTLSIPLFLPYHLAIKRRVVEKILYLLSSKPTYTHITALCDLAETGKNGSTIHLPNGLTVEKTESYLYFIHKPDRITRRGQQPLSTTIPQTIASFQKMTFSDLQMQISVEQLIEKPHSLSYNEFLLDGDKCDFPFTVRYHLPGERFSPVGMKGSKKISKHLSDMKIPQWKRIMHPILCHSAGILGILGIRADRRCTVDENSCNFILVRWISSDGED